MAEKVVAILKKDSYFASGVFTPAGLYQTALPRLSEKAALEAVRGEALQRSTDMAHLSVLELVFAMTEGRSDIDYTEIEYDFSGITTKQQAVLETLLTIPRGETISYGDLARLAGLPGAARFVGNVMANNRFGPLIPCHRVVTSSGLGGYGPGLKRKIEILRREGAI